MGTVLGRLQESHKSKGKKNRAHPRRTQTHIHTKKNKDGKQKTQDYRNYYSWHLSTQPQGCECRDYPLYFHNSNPTTTIPKEPLQETRLLPHSMHPFASLSGTQFGAPPVPPMPFFGTLLACANLFAQEHFRKALRRSLQPLKVLASFRRGLALSPPSTSPEPVPPSSTAYVMVSI